MAPALLASTTIARTDALPGVSTKATYVQNPTISVGDPSQTIFSFTLPADTQDRLIRATIRFQANGSGRVLAGFSLNCSNDDQDSYGTSQNAFSSSTGQVDMSFISETSSASSRVCAVKASAFKIDGEGSSSWTVQSGSFMSYSYAADSFSKTRFWTSADGESAKLAPGASVVPFRATVYGTPKGTTVDLPVDLKVSSCIGSSGVTDESAVPAGSDLCGGSVRAGASATVRVQVYFRQLNAAGTDYCDGGPQPAFSTAPQFTVSALTHHKTFEDVGQEVLSGASACGTTVRIWAEVTNTSSSVADIVVHSPSTSLTLANAS
ncbi:hypothetical protein K8Z61_14140 [Nocardioides sp. TRM66260-LWL]|uniref:hypothetical protein n=1 Tax=Nocardioides sp. TRM66260-LWL TaxID=2874478 RepID=UPI001CC4DB0F|nr:hypothetical protein [Nocardioides sp. TRM66260-LWL]MBZ5735632.1 hypothetical protein [Nocardioides sp. TRM66260-LWL]